MFHPSDFLVLELQAARIIKQKESCPDETTAEDQSEKEQRVEDHSHELVEQHEDDVSREHRRKSEMQAEWILLLHALDMDPSSQLSDVLGEVSLTYNLLCHNFKVRSADRTFNMLYNAGGDEACSPTTWRDD